ncbi:hypothetical protein Pmani_027034 [Petrolisthes manimaculis]|uniref:Uncharacterized protein n=1 Tax=Petrolisthes manimaculis TaxID=1843537 RepID=A0AAE1P500_9EUCA|nr:hypothetical protein Pmani_027034 [Petrolisthes manimaculis]
MEEHRLGSSPHILYRSTASLVCVGDGERGTESENQCPSSLSLQGSASDLVHGGFQLEGNSTTISLISNTPSLSSLTPSSPPTPVSTTFSPSSSASPSSFLTGKSSRGLTSSFNESYTTEVHWQVHRALRNPTCFDNSLEDLDVASDSGEESGTDSEAEREITSRHHHTCNKDGDDKRSEHTDSTLRDPGSVTDSHEDDSGQRATMDIKTDSEDYEIKTMGIKTQSRLSISGSYYRDRFPPEVWKGVELFIREEHEQEVMMGGGPPLTPRSYRKRWHKTGEHDDNNMAVLGAKSDGGENRNGRVAENDGGTDLDDTDYYYEETDVAETDFNETDVCESDSDDDNNDGTDIGGETDFNETDIGETDYNETDIGETDYNETDIGETDCNETDCNETDIGETDYNGTDIGESYCNETDAGDATGNEDSHQEGIPVTKANTADDQQPPQDQKTSQDAEGNENSRDESKKRPRNKMNRLGRMTRPSHGELEMELPEREKKKKEKSHVTPSPTTKKTRTRERRVITRERRVVTRRLGQTGSREQTKTSVRRLPQSPSGRPPVGERKLPSSLSRWEAASQELYRTPRELPTRSHSLAAGDEETTRMTRELSKMRCQMVTLRKTIHDKNEEIKELKTRLKMEKTTARSRELHQEKQINKPGVEFVTTTELSHIRRGLVALRREKEGLRMELLAKEAAEKERKVELKKYKQEQEKDLRKARNEAKREAVRDNRELSQLQKAIETKDKVSTV